MPRREPGSQKPRQRTGPGKLKSMRVADTFRDYVLEQLAGVKRVHARAMFGGIGLYADDLFFGLIAADTLYFKVDDTNRPAYEAAGMEPFRPFADKPMTMSYYQVPVAVLEDSAGLTAWANAAIKVAATKGARAPRRPARRRTIRR